MPVQVNFHLLFGTRRDQEAGVHVGYCPALNIYSQGRSEDEAQEAVVDAAKLFIINCYRRDILNRVLRDCGMTEAVEGSTGSKQFIEIEHFDHQFERDVPIELLSAQYAEATAACHS